MRGKIKRILSIALAASMVASFVPIVSAEEQTDGPSYFDFEASEYESNENSGELKIKVMRHGGVNGEVNVSFKAADFLSSYGIDYDILDGNGEPLAKVEGEKPDPSEFVYDDGAETDSAAEGIMDDTEAGSPEADAGADIKAEEPVDAGGTTAEKEANDPAAEPPEADADQDVTEQDVKEETEDPADSGAAFDAADADIEADIGEKAADAGAGAAEGDAADQVSIPIDEDADPGETVEMIENADKKSKSTGSSILDAQAQYLDLPEGGDASGIESAANETLNDIYSYFLAAEGAEGVINFADGESEKEITVRVYDNDAAESDKLFMLALTGTDTDDTTIAANATTYVTIADDEEYETPVFDLVDNGLVLSSSAPEGYITVRKTGGTQYFSMVYVSTVKSTADRTSYEEFEGQTVAFVPGETEKQIKVQAYDFSKNAAFGVRLEGDESAQIGNYYVDVNIAADENAADSDDAEVSLTASNTVLGNASTMPRNQVEIDGGWRAEDSGSDGDNEAYVSGSNMHLEQYDCHDYSMLVSNNKIDFTGIKNLRFSMEIYGDGSDFTTRFETDTDQTYAGYSGAQFQRKGKMGWTENDLDVSGVNDGRYLKYAVYVNSGWWNHNPKSTIDWIRFDWAKYSFEPQNSVENFNRKLYDFTSLNNGQANVSDLYYDGETTRIYNPGSVTVRSGGQTVDGFYGNNTSPITIEDANSVKNAEKGIYLAGVYFCKGDITDHTLYENGRYRSSNVYYVSADNSSHAVTVTPNQNFIKTLINKGVLSSANKDETIKIYPVYKQETVTVNFENTDRDDTKSDSKGKYDPDHLCSHILNIIEACDGGMLSKQLHAGWLDYYSIQVPKYSVIRVKTAPAGDRTPAGVRWWYHYNNAVGGIEYYKEGETKFSGDSSSGVTIDATDYTMADIVADNSLSMCPATGDQTFYVGYSPMAYENDSEEITDDFRNVVTNTTEGGAGETTDASGSMWLKDPYIGKNYNLTAYAPEGYYISWANMSGDTDNDGTIGDSGDDGITSRTDRNNSSNPTYVYGNKLNISLDQDNTRYYYEFVPKVMDKTRTQSGKVVREKTNLYDLVNGKKTTEYVPVSGAYMNIAGFTGMTDANGNYSIEMGGLPSWGTVSASLSVDGMEYNATASIESRTQMVLPALERFTADSVSAAYDVKTGSVADNMVTVEDDTLRLKVSVSSGSAVTPSKARFYIYNDQGYQAVDCSAKPDDYVVTESTNGTNYTAELAFNPKKDMAFGYKVYVQFCDQNGKWYTPIDTGYDFYAALTLDEFIFPMIGSSSLEDVITTGVVEDIIGNPLGDIDLGSISAFKVTGSSYTPENIPEEDKAKYTWLQNSYSFGFSKELGSGSKEWDSKKSYEEQMGEYLKKVESGDITGAAPAASKYNTQGSFKWSVTPSVGFNLTLSSRSDGNTYFEDLIFYVKADFDASADQKIVLPIGLGILVSFQLNGDMAGIYHMYNDYQDSYETEDAVPYTSEDFGVFKKFNNSVRREGYIFLNPEVAVGLGVDYNGIIAVKGNARFTFDMDFRFGESRTDAYGDMRVDLGWQIDLIGFTVYSKNYEDVTTTKLFNTDGQNEHIDFDYEQDPTISLSSVSDFMSQDSDADLIMDMPVSRDYLDNRGDWNSNTFSLMSNDNGTTETELLKGAAGNPYVSVTKINDSEMLMVFVDDDTDRNDVNKRAVFYSIGDGDNWSEPQLIDDDGTMDDYPDVYDLGDRLLVTWSSADKEFESGATVEDALKSLNIKAAFFDKTDKTFGEITQLTKTTDEDYTADVLPRAAYDSQTDRIILYYTKTEYDDLSKQSDIADAASVTAYLFYENGAWSNDGSYYTDEELEGVDDKDTYREQWYGQRFLDVRIDSSSPEMLRIVDTDAISYNGLALFAWTVDWDRDLETINDRDVFMQIYNFSENSFTHNIRVTSETGTYMSPKFGRADNDVTYLFYGEQDEESDHGEIKYLDVTDAISNNKYALITEGTTSYYVLQNYKSEHSYTLSDGTEVTTPAETIPLEADNAVAADNIIDYDVCVDGDGKLYLFWTDMNGTSREIFASAFNGNAVYENDADEVNAAEDESGAGSGDGTSEEAFWSDPVMLTSGGEDVFYSGIGVSVVDGVIYAGCGKGSYNDDADSSLVLVKHIPYDDIKLTGVSLSDTNPAAGGNVTVTAEIRNEGLLPEYDPVTITFEMNGEVVGTQSVGSAVPGGTSEYVDMNMTMPEDISDVTIEAYINDDEPVSVKVEQAAEIDIANGTTDLFVDEEGAERYAFIADLTNIGNKDFGELKITARSKDSEIGSAVMSSLAVGETAQLDLTLDVSDDMYDITDGVGKAAIEIEITSDGETVREFEEEITKEFDSETIALLDKVTDVEFENDGKYTLNVGDEKQIQPVINGVEDGQLKVKWLSSSDSGVASIDFSNTIMASGEGKTTLTGMLVPYKDTVIFDSFGNAEITDWSEEIPEGDIITVTAEITVTDDGAEPSESPEATRRPNRGGGGSSVRATESPAPSETPTDLPASSESPVSGESIFDDISGHWAEDYIERLAADGIVNGMSDRMFEPDGNITRAQFAQILMNTGLVGSGSIEVPVFDDVMTDAWYSEAVNWAVSCGVAEGMGDGTFAPEALITREQMAAMVNRFITIAGISADKGNETVFTDAESISDWAVEDVNTLASMGIINGRDTGEFDPKANMTRAEGTVVICNILDVKEVN